MLKHFLFILFVIPSICNAQFIFKEPNVDDLKKKLDQNPSLDIIQLYLSANYSASNKSELNYYAGSNEICAYKQVFDEEIQYLIDECAEEGGVRSKLILPKASLHQLKEWIVKMDSNDLTEIDNSWNENGTIYRPTDKGVGCYYSIINNDKSTIVEVWCGC